MVRVHAAGLGAGEGRKGARVVERASDRRLDRLSLMLVDSLMVYLQPKVVLFGFERAHLVHGSAKSAFKGEPS